MATAAAAAGGLSHRELQSLDPFDTAGFIALRLTDGTSSPGTSSNRFGETAPFLCVKIPPTRSLLRLVFTLHLLASSFAIIPYYAVTTQSINIDDFGGCLPSDDSSYSSTCSAVRTLEVPSQSQGYGDQNTFPCTLGTNAESGRLSKSADGLLVTFYCFRQYAGITLWDTGNIDPFK